jgi:hypothetical protein
MRVIAWPAFVAGGCASDPQDATDASRDVAIDYSATKRADVIEQRF